MAIAGASSACNLHNEGVDAPRGALSYPQALTLSRDEETAERQGDGPDFLYVANTNYDLRYNGGSVQSYDLKAIDRALARNRCRTLDPSTSADASVAISDRTTYDVRSRLDAGVLDAGDGGDAGVPLPPLGMDASAGVEIEDWAAVENTGSPRGVLCDNRDPQGDGRTMVPGAVGDEVPNPDCCWGEQDEILAVQRAHVSTDSYASGIAVTPDNKRLYVPIESFTRLLYMDVATPGVPDCDTSGRCRRGPGLNSDDDSPEAFPRQIASLHVGKMSELGITKAGDPTYILTSHELGGVGLFVDEQNGGGPVLEDALSGQGRPVRPMSLTWDPRHKLFYVTANAQPFFTRVGVRLNEAGSYDGREQGPRELLYESSRVTLSGVSSANDLRDVTLDPFDDNRVWVLIRGVQESLALLDLDASRSNNASLLKAIRVGDGPSKIARIQQDGRWFILVSCYDEKAIFVIDAQSREVERVVRNLSGPFQMVHDPVRRLLYVTDFRVSVVRVIDVAGLTQSGVPDPRIIATLGDPEFQAGSLR